MQEVASAKLSIDPARLPESGALVIDVGCGDGRHVAAAARRGCDVVGIDYDVAELRRARERVAEGQFIVGDATRLPFRDGCAAAIICTETLEHLPDDRGAMREITRVLRPGGALLGAVPSHFTEMLYFRLSRGYRNAPGGHVRIYAPHVLAARLRNCGLHVRAFRYVHFVDSLVWLRYCLSDALRTGTPATGFEAAVMLAEAQARPVAPWRRALRRGIAESRFVALIDRAGALVWPKSFCFVAAKVAPPADRGAAENASSPTPLEVQR